MSITKSLIKIKHLTGTLAASILLFLITSGLANANISPQETTEKLDQQRETYQKALSAFNKRQLTRFRQYKAELTNYPLYPYLEYKDLKRNLVKKNQQRISNFLKENSDSPISKKLRSKLLSKLATKKQWRDFLQFYKSPQSNKLKCTYLKALYKEGFIEPAFQRVPELWTVGKSQHKNCDFIFKAFTAAGRLTKDLKWQRIELAMKNRKFQLARFLSKDFDNADLNWVNLWIKAYRRPERLYKAKLILQHHEKRFTILTHIINRQARKNPDKAINLLSYIKQKTDFPYQREISVYKSIGLSMARKHNDDAEQWLNKIPDDYATLDIIQWKIQNGIRHATWPAVIKHIEVLPVTLQQKIRWQFWWAYAHKKLGNAIESDETLKRIALKRDYYGFLAADLMNQPYHFENKPIKVDEYLISKITNQKGIQRAREFYHFNQILLARREWNNTITNYSDDELLTAAKIAHGWGWHDRAIAAIGKTKNLNDIEIRFPLAFKDIVDNYSNLTQIDSAWTYAIIRRESIFIRDAKSEKGALGLMQLMPRTARATARAIKTSYQGKRQLIKTRPNIRLGTHYLKYLYNKHKQTVLATAAYNAGTRNVKKWLPSDEPMEAIRWIESIPYKETREYVINVLAYNIIYQHRMELNDKTLISQLMPPVPAKI